MNPATFFPDWREKVVFATGRPQPQVLYADEKIKLVLVGLDPSCPIPAHPSDAGVYHFLEGTGQMHVGEDSHDVRAGSTVIVPAGAVRGITPHTPLAFIGIRIA